MGLHLANQSISFDGFNSRVDRPGIPSAKKKKKEKEKEKKETAAGRATLAAPGFRGSVHRSGSICAKERTAFSLVPINYVVVVVVVHDAR